MSSRPVGTDVNQIQITSLSHIRGRPQVIEQLKLHVAAHFNIAWTAKSTPPFGPVILWRKAKTKMKSCGACSSTSTRTVKMVSNSCKHFVVLCKTPWKQGLRRMGICPSSFADHRSVQTHKTKVR